MEWAGLVKVDHSYVIIMMTIIMERKPLLSKERTGLLLLDIRANQQINAINASESGRREKKS